MHTVPERGLCAIHVSEICLCNACESDVHACEMCMHGRVGEYACKSAIPLMRQWVKFLGFQIANPLIFQKMWYP